MNKLNDGAYSVQIACAEKTKSRAGRDMIVLRLNVYGTFHTINHYIVFMENKPDITGRQIHEVMECFDIEKGDTTLSNWTGKTGGVIIKNELYNGKMIPKIERLLTKREQNTLPKFKVVHAGEQENVIEKENVIEQDSVMSFAEYFNQMEGK